MGPLALVDSTPGGFWREPLPDFGDIGPEGGKKVTCPSAAAIRGGWESRPHHSHQNKTKVRQKRLNFRNTPGMNPTRQNRFKPCPSLLG
jgi:hypothetical protein